MSDKGAADPNSLARQYLDNAIRRIEDNYKNDLAAAAMAKENALRDAAAAKTEAVNTARATIEYFKKRLSEARDRIEAGLRKRDFDQARRAQEQMLAKAEQARIAAIKQAEILGKRLVTEAGERRKHAIQQAHDDEKQMKLEAVQAARTQKEDARTRLEDERKARQKAGQENAEAKNRAEKAAAAERSARQALEKSRGKTGERKPEKAQAAAPPPVKPLAKPETTAPAQPAAPVVKSETTAPPQPAAPVVKPETYAPPKLIAPVAKPESNIYASPRLKESAQKQPEAPKPVEAEKALGRSGMIKLIILNKETTSRTIDFENALHKIAGIRIVMIGGTTKEGSQIIVSAEKSVALSAALRQLPMVEEADDRSGEILIKLKPPVTS